jgi:hypothetical protein
MQMTSKNNPVRSDLQELTGIDGQEFSARDVTESGRQNSGRNGKWARRTHAFLGIVSSLNLLLLISTGFLLQHASLLKLDEKTIPRGVLPSTYRPQDGAYGVRADIFVADLHSGRLFGTAGALALDAITLAWLTLLTTGLVMYVGKQRAKQKALNEGPVLEDEG